MSATFIPYIFDKLASCIIRVNVELIFRMQRVFGQKEFSSDILEGLFKKKVLWGFFLFLCPEDSILMILVVVEIVPDF